MKLAYILAFATVAIFLVSLPFCKSPRKFYLLFILLFLPFIDLPIATESFGGYKVFDFISLIISFFLYKDFLYIDKKSKKYILLLFALIVTLFFGSLNSQFVNNSLKNILSVFPIFIYAHLFVKECRLNEMFKEEIILALQIIVVFSVFFLIIQITIGIDFTFYPELNRNTNDPNGLRYPSFFHDPQKYGQYLAMISFTFLINKDRLETPKLKNYLAFLVVIIAMLATGGRSAFIGLFIGLLFLCLVLGVKYRLALATTVIIGGLLVLSLSDSLAILDRSESFSEDLLVRTELWNDAYNIFAEHPLLGIGIGNFKEFAIAHSSNYFIKPNNDVVFFDQPESGYWMMLTETGILAVILYFLFIIIPIVAKIKNYLWGTKPDLINFFFIASIFSWLVSFISLYSISDKRILVVLIVLVCLLISDKKKIKYAIFRR